MKRIIYLIISLIIVSCGYKRTEKDKHPDIPIFPKHTNPKIKITPFPFDSHGIILKNDEFYFNETCYKYEKENVVVLLDRKYQKIKDLDPLISLYNINKLGEAYIIKNIKTKSEKILDLFEIEKRWINDAKKKQLINDKFLIKGDNYFKIKDSIKLSLENKIASKDQMVQEKIIDSLYDIVDKKNQKKKKQLLNSLKFKLTSIFYLGDIKNNDIYIFKYPNIEKCYVFDKNFYLDESFKEKYTTLNLEKDLKRLASFGEVTLENDHNYDKGMGNRDFITPLFFYKNNKLAYYELGLKEEKTKFKFLKNWGNSELLIKYRSNDTIILKTLNAKTKSQLFYVTLNK